MTNGLSMINKLEFNLISKACLSTFFISFGGLSIHLQVMSILSDYKINYFIYLIARLLHGGISALLVFLILTYH